MVLVYLDEEIENFEADIRDLCMAFFPYEKIMLKNIIEEKNSIENIENINTIIYPEDFYKNKIFNNRLDKKNHIKRSLYKYLKKITHKNLLWGALTGIRPVNIVTNLLESNKKNNSPQILKYLKKEYLISDEKGKLLINIAKNEEKILKRKKIKDYKKAYSIYIGVPFCKSTCLYCSFASYDIEKNKKYVNDFLIALENELRNSTKERLKPLTLYIGGGTPTSFSDEDFLKFLNIVIKYIDVKNIVEWTIEAGRPDTINENKLLLMKKYGVSRISINPQTFNQKTLDLIGRKHTIEDIKEKYSLARKVGFDNINMDIILGLPDEKLNDVVNTLIEIGKLKPDSLTVHSLALKRAARLNLEKENWVNNHYLAGLDEKSGTIYNMFKCSEYLSKLLCLKPYYLYRQKNIAGNLENVGYAKNNKECIYNIMMMSERHTVYGFGGGASTKIVKYKGSEKIVERIEGYKGLMEYINFNS